MAAMCLLVVDISKISVCSFPLVKDVLLYLLKQLDGNNRYMASVAS